MQMLLRLLRRHGEPIPRELVETTDWTVGRIESGSISAFWPRQCLVFLALQSTPGTGVLAELRRPTIEFVGTDHMVIRGIERVACADGRIAAVVQDWCLKPRPAFGPLGNHSPENKGLRDRLDQPGPPPI